MTAPWRYSARRLRGINAFVVENTDEIRVLYAEALTSRGAAVQSAETPEAALQATAQFLPDIVITDLTFGGLRRDGLWLLSQFRSSWRLRRARIIAITGHQLDATWRDPHAFDAVLTKPIDIEQLIALVERLGRSVIRPTQPG